jgi:hypothetical protein
MRISDSAIFKKIEQLERLYGRTLLEIDKKFEAAFHAYFEADKIYKSLQACIRSLMLPPSRPSAADINPLLDEYLVQIEAIHRINAACLKHYLQLTWPDQISAKNARLWKNEAAKNKFDGAPQLPDVILQLKTRRDECPSDSAGWLEIHKQLVAKTYDELLGQANDSRQQINHGFKKILYTHPLGHQETPRRQQIIDWICGYKAAGAAEVAAADLVDDKFSGPLMSCGIHRRKKLALRYASWIFMSLLLVWGIHGSRMDTKVYALAHDGLMKLFQLDPASIRLKQREKFFNKYIVDFNGKAGEKQITENLLDFTGRRLYRTPEGAYYFADKILTDFFLLLSSQPVSRELKLKVIHAAGLLDDDIQKQTADLIFLFDGPSIQEKELKSHVLSLRRAFVKQDVFPFTFIVIKNEIPYLFIFPEKIIHKYLFYPENFQTLGLKGSPPSHDIQYPLYVYVVPGDRYPFKDRAGYFEGEYAIVFAGLAASAEWTAWHEFGHIIDKIRFLKGHVPLPQNIETNAVLFPAIFSGDAKLYMLNRLLPIVKVRDADDAYVQASKGILNGFDLWLSRQAGGAKIPLITDELKMNDIQAMEVLISGLSNDQIKSIARTIYQYPDEFLKTARPGQYRGIISNAEEVTAGTPRAPFQGFILTGFGQGTGGGNSKMKFLFDANEDDQDSIWGRNFLIFLEQVFFSIFHRAKYGGSSAQNIFASVLVFLIIEGMLFVPHLLGTPLRKRKFLGRKLPDMVHDMYKNHPISDGRSYGEQAGEKYLVSQVYACRGNLTPELKNRITAFKAGASAPRRALFDCALTLAPFNPVKSKITSKWHDFVFWLPFLGPLAARNPRLFNKQKSFEQWEKFNRQVIALARKIDGHMTPEAFKRSYASVIEAFKNPEPSAGGGIPLSTHLMETEKLVILYLNEARRAGDSKKPVRTRSRLGFLGSQIEDFDHLAPYSFSDDIKRIDWKATARSPGLEAKIKKYANASGAQIDFLMDLRSLSNQQARERIARDFVQSLQNLKRDSELKDLVMIMPGGDVRQKNLELRSRANPFGLGTKIWMSIKNEFEKYQSECRALEACDLKFYTAEENRSYRQTAQLTDFGQQHRPSEKLPKITARSFNVYMIGIKKDGHEDNLQALSRNHQLFYWP